MNRTTPAASASIVIALAVLLGGCSANSTRVIPPGAAALGYTKCVIDERPAVADIAPGHTGNYKWFNALWYQPSAPMNKFEMVNGILAVHPFGGLVSTPHDMLGGGRIPTLPGKDGFYVEFDVRTSDNNPIHNPAVWMTPIENNGRGGDHYDPDPKDVQRFMELDIDEGGFGPGMTGTVHNWYGIPGTFLWHNHLQNPNNILPTPLDRSQWHTFGASYDPTRNAVTWWLDGIAQMSATPPAVPDIAKRQHFYLLISPQNRHHQEKDYEMFVGGVRAYVPPTSPLPAVPVSKPRFHASLK